MKYVDEYRDPRKVRQLAEDINAELKKPCYRIMEVCGTHTAAIHRFGLRGLLSKKIELISGPGCPVCVTSDGYLENVFRLARDPGITIATYADMLRVPAGGRSLESLRSQGADVRSVISGLEALELARSCPDKEVVFLGVGFETTAPGTALALEPARKEKIKNFSVYSAHKTIPEPLAALAKDRELALDGFLLPGHVSAVIGVDGYRHFFEKARSASVITGFEPLDILLAIYRIVKAVNIHKPVLENEYSRIVDSQGNARAKKILAQCFDQKDSVWRGLGVISDSGLFLKASYKDFDAEKKFSLKKERTDAAVKRGCRCADVLKGKIAPNECRFFAKSCTPREPMGPCMVSREGTCRSYFEYHG